MKRKAKKRKSLGPKEKKMFRDYVKAREAKSPGVLKAWARKYKVKLRSRNRGTFERSCPGARSPAPAPGQAQTLFLSGCTAQCPDQETDWTVTMGYGRHKRTVKIPVKCTARYCWYDKVSKKWHCNYNCSFQYVT
jgi:hypothetical protein